jgi:hypothetical protein
MTRFRITAMSNALRRADEISVSTEPHDLGLQRARALHVRCGRLHGPAVASLPVLVWHEGLLMVYAAVVRIASPILALREALK